MKWMTFNGWQPWLGRASTCSLVVLSSSLAAAQTFTITTLSPTRNARTVAVSAPVAVAFSQAPTAASAGTIRVFSSQYRGLRAATASVSGTTATLTPTGGDFRPGEVLSVSVPATVATSAGNTVVPQVYQFTAAAGAATGTFAGSAAYATDAYPSAVAVGDFNGDGYLDLLSANLLGNSVSVLLNAGAGTFPASSPAYATGNSPLAVAVGDLNGDGNLDVATANNNDNTVSVLLNTGSPSATNLLAPAVAYAVGTSPAGIALGDVDRDGDLDLVATSTTGNTVSVLLNGGSGTFATAVAYATGTFPLGVALADVDSDGDLDLLTANAKANTVAVLLGTGTGTFGAATPYATGLNPTSVAVGDVNNDAFLDVVTANADANTLSVLLNGGAGTFASGAAYATGTSPGSVALSDVNGDGALDITAANGNAATLSVLLNAGTGTFSSATAYATGTGPAAIAIGDVSGDGTLDLLTANGSATTSSVLLGSAAPLPVVLTAFTATRQGTSAVLVWATASEVNNAGFVVEASADGSTFQALSRVAGQGTSATAHSYAYTDARLPDYGVPVVYYRLRQLDLDGSATFSPVRSVAVPAAAASLVLYPNPAHDALVVAGASSGAAVQVFDATGRLVLAAGADASGAAQLALPAGLPAGLYVVRSGTEARRLVVE